MLEGRPFLDDERLLEAARRVWWDLGREDWLEAFAAHPRIGERPAAGFASHEQAGMDGAAAGIRAALAEGNRRYEQRFGHVFLICATGRGADELLAELRRRLGNDPSTELREAAAEQARITELRLSRLVGR
jgi:OHCU decarboxylase